jgi:hypothetical protein
MASRNPVQNKGPAETPARLSFEPPFVGREREISQLGALHAQRKHALIIGPAGVGKSALVEHLREQLSLLVSGKSAHIGGICDGLEPQLRLSPAGLKLLERKKRLREALGAAGRVVAFDGVGWTGPKVSSLFESVAERAPVWICTRSEHPWDIGHFWPLLARFARVEVRAFRPSETEELIEAAAGAGMLPEDSRAIVPWLHRRSGGNPLVLRELCEELASGRYDLSSPYALKRLELDRQIHETFPNEDGGVASHRGRSA